MKDKFQLSLEENVFLAKKVLARSVYGAARIEGVNATYPETETILDGVNVAGVGLDDIRVILNLRDGWRFLLSEVEDKEVDLDFIAKLNENVARNESLDWGKLRTGEVGIRGTKHKPKVPVEGEVRAQIGEILGAEGRSVTEKAIDLMLYIMNEQLFWDGNKRTAGLAANAVLIGGGAGVLTVTEENVGEFNEKLTKFYDTQDGGELKRFLYEQCIFGLEFGG
jgi:prophage maintenance system killer protein